jgi:hypothetical protein
MQVPQAVRKPDSQGQYRSEQRIRFDVRGVLSLWWSFDLRERCELVHRCDVAESGPSVARHVNILNVSPWDGG